MKKHLLTMTDALAGYELAAEARRLSPETMAGYRNAFRKFLDYLAADPPIASITRETINGFLAAQDTVSRATLLKYHTSLSSLWTWALREQIVTVHVPHQVERPKAEKRDIVPIPEADVRALLSMLSKTATYKRAGQRESSHTPPAPDRNRAIILTLLDTGVRASELCALQIRHCDLRNKDKFISVVSGKGSKDRHIPISPRTAQAIWRYLASRPDARMNEALFATSTSRHMDRNNLGNILESLANRAGVPNINPHRFRHTFAINYLRNGGDIYTLKAILGHESLNMCLTYLRLAQADLEDAHRRASPVDHWNL